MPRLKPTQVERLAVAEYINSFDIELLTGIPASNWRNMALEGIGPPSQKVGRRRIWKKSAVLAWIEAQGTAST